MNTFTQTPSQTVGPYFAYGLTPEQYHYDFKSIIDGNMVSDTIEGDRITIVGKVIDGQGEPIPDAMIELWQSDIQAIGRQGTGTNPQNQFIFTTIKPVASGEASAPHISVIVFMRGLLVHAYTRLYFSDEASANAQDSVLQSVPADRRHTLIAEKKQVNGQTIYELNIYMQGDLETVFFDV
jgi:protocatechuate 3,4-dioxygenase, alpha subunit